MFVNKNQNIKHCIVVYVFYIEMILILHFLAAQAFTVNTFGWAKNETINNCAVIKYADT